MGLEVREPVVDERALAANVTNEGGYDGTITLLKNVMGLWFVQQCRSALWSPDERPSYEELSVMAARGPSGRPSWTPPTAASCGRATCPPACASSARETGQAVPADTPTLLRVILESLALRYAVVFDELETVTGQPIEQIHIVGGGANNTLLCQLTADATGRPVVAGPVEATAIGNIAIQAIATGELRDIHQARELIARSFPTVTYEPTGDWSEARADTRRCRPRGPGSAAR